MSKRLLVALWPAFLMAGVLEMLTFAVIDPAELRWFGGELIGWSSQAVYTVTFLIFWAVMATATGITALLMATAAEVNEEHGVGDAGDRPPLHGLPSH